MISIPVNVYGSGRCGLSVGGGARFLSGYFAVMSWATAKTAAEAHSRVITSMVPSSAAAYACALGSRDGQVPHTRLGIAGNFEQDCQGDRAVPSLAAEDRYTVKVFLLNLAHRLRK